MTRPSRRTLGVVTVSRSDYGHLLPVLEEIQRAPNLRLLLFVAGMHLAPEFGRTVAAVEADGWPIAERIEMLEPDDSPEAVAVSMGRGITGLARAYVKHQPDLVVVLGDRFEMLSATVAALPLAIPVAHIHGGELSEGAIDNQIRHAITKMAHLHFASAEPHARRIVQMGEESWRVHTVGAPGLDRIRTMELLAREAVAEALALDPSRRWLVVTLHPVTLEYQHTAAHVDELIAALDKVDVALVITAPNADTAGRTIIGRLKEFVASSPSARFVESLGDRLYLSLLKHAAAMVGNSSSGLIEAPTFELPVVNIGNRQRGRLRGANVIDVGYTRNEILHGIATALAPGFRDQLRAVRNPYGDGHAASRIVRVLSEVTLDARLIQKQFPECNAP